MLLIFVKTGFHLIIIDYFLNFKVSKQKLENKLNKFARIKFKKK